MKCKICTQENKVIFSTLILNKYNARYFHCSQCGFLQTEDPYWIKEAYKTPINVSDTGYMARNIMYSKKIALLIRLFFDEKAKYLDYGGGHGVFVRLMRDIGFDFYWADIYTKNIFSIGFEWDKKEKVEMVTLFECFEHFINPTEDIEKILSLSKNIVFSTKLLPLPIPKPEEWWYFGLDHGQHLSFYSRKTFEYIKKKYHLHYTNIDSLHFLTKKKISSIKLKLLNLSTFRFEKFFRSQLKSKTWEDHLKMSI